MVSEATHTIELEADGTFEVELTAAYDPDPPRRIIRMLRWLAEALRRQ